MNNHKQKAGLFIHLIEFEDGSINVYTHQGGDTLSDEKTVAALSRVIADLSHRVASRQQT